jgi:hypothetical protein
MKSALLLLIVRLPQISWLRICVSQSTLRSSDRIKERTYVQEIFGDDGHERWCEYIPVDGARIMIRSSTTKSAQGPSGAKSHRNPYPTTDEIVSKQINRVAAPLLNLVTTTTGRYISARPPTTCSYHPKGVQPTILRCQINYPDSVTTQTKIKS